jgi:hexosaminidase
MQRNTRHTVYLLLVLAASALLVCDSADADIQNDLGIMLIPQPAKVTRHEGFFTLNPGTAIEAGPRARDAAGVLQGKLAAVTGMRLEVGEGVPQSDRTNTIALKVEEGPSPSYEAYFLAVTREGIRIVATDEAGLFHACQTLHQLLPLRTVIGLPPELIRWEVPCVTISDRARFPWRGLMLDCSRTFQSIDYIKRTLDRMAFYKLNVLHLHLTDDQGWRLEIKAYPELTEKGSRFPDEYGEPESHQGFYTQAEMKDLVAYAAARHITIVPEIEMPGHALAALSCFPRLSCSGGPFAIHPFFEGPGIHEEIFCAGSDEVFTFLETVLGEVLEIFPSQYIHIGGDEAPKKSWRNCSRCQARIRDEGLADEHELQSYFIRRIGRFIQSRGRTLIGWDEILEGGLAEGAAVMSWRGTKGGIAAAKAGHDVVMSPTSHCYFDYTYERIDTRRAFSFEPIPAELDADEAKHVLGLQANFWSHIDREPAKVDGQIFPRLMAIAERGWSPAGETGGPSAAEEGAERWEDFQWRVKMHLVHLDDFGVNYRRDPAAPAIPPVARWEPSGMSETYSPLDWDVTEHIAAAGRYRVRLQYTHGSHRLGIEKVELLADGEPVCTDAHRGETGNRHLDNDYLLELGEHRAGACYTLRVTARSEGGTDSNGEIFLSRED